YDSKDGPLIPAALLKLLLDKLSTYYNSINNNIFRNTIIAIDGTYNNNNNNHEEILNMGFYDIGNFVPPPIDIRSFGKEGKNREIKSATEYREYTQIRTPSPF